MDKKYLFLSIMFIVLISRMSYLNILDREIRKVEVEERYTDLGTTFNLLGIERFGASILWVKQTLNIGETLERDSSEDIEKNAMEIAYINPYFLENYYSSSVVLGLIRVYNRYDKALKILEFGMKYNPEDTYLKRYYAGIAANSKGEDEEVIKNFEKIVKKFPDPLLLNILIDLYEKRWEKKSIIEDKKKLVTYLIMLYNLNDGKYREKVEEKLIKYGVMIK